MAKSLLFLILLVLPILSFAEQLKAWIRIINLIEPDISFTDTSALRSVVLHNPRHNNQLEDFIYKIKDIPYYGISKSWLPVNASNVRAIKTEGQYKQKDNIVQVNEKRTPPPSPTLGSVALPSPTGTAYIVTLSDDPFTPLNTEFYVFLEVLFVEVEEQAILTLVREEKMFTGSVCNLGPPVEMESKTSTLHLCIHNNQLLMLNYSRIVIQTVDPQCQGNCIARIISGRVVHNSLVFVVPSQKWYITVKYLGDRVDTELCGFLQDFQSKNEYSSVLRDNSSVSTMYECVTFGEHNPTNIVLAIVIPIVIMSLVIVLCVVLFIVYRRCPTVTRDFRRTFSSNSKPPRKPLSIHLQRSVESIKEPQYETPYRDLDDAETYRDSPYQDVEAPEDTYEDIEKLETYRSSPSNTYSDYPENMSHISLDSRRSKHSRI